MIMLIMLLVCAQSCMTLCNPRGCSPSGSSVHGIFQGKNTGVGCHFLLQGIFQTQRLNLGFLCLLHWQAGYVCTVQTVKSDMCNGQVHPWEFSIGEKLSYSVTKG